MGFRTGAYAKVWEVTPMSDTSKFAAICNANSKMGFI